jgi:FtsP/CotA-like multicopper oxidase with cupredoxin domain
MLATSSFADDFYLAAKQFNMTMPGGASVAMWGFVSDPGGACYNAPSNEARLTCINGLPAPKVPGPKLSVVPGATDLQIFLSNGLGAPTSVVIPGLEMPVSDGGSGPTWLDNSTGPRPGPGARVRSFGAEAAANGGRRDYRWTATNGNPPSPGTYAYQTGTHPQVQVQMGLYGALTQDSAAGQAYPGVAYAQERHLFFSEVDPALHAAVAAGTYGTPQGPTSTLNHVPKYFLLQGYDAAGAPTDVTIDASSVPPACIDAGVAVGQRLLLRMYNMGLRELAPMLIGAHFELVAEGGRANSVPKTQYQTLLKAGSTQDLIFTPAYGGQYKLIERRLSLTDPGAEGSVSGGMQTCLAVGAAGPCLYDLQPSGGDKDVDGLDLHAYAPTAAAGTVAAFAQEFGRTNCQ